MDFPIAKFTNKFRNFQTISQHLDNKQDVNIFETYLHLFDIHELNQDLWNRPRLNPENNNLYILNHVLKTLTQHIFHWMCSLAL